MSSYETQFKEHQIHETLAQFQSAINKEFNYELDEIAIDNLDHLRLSADYITDKLNNCNPSLTPAAKLDQILKFINSALTHVNQFSSDGNSGELANASNSIDAALNASTTIISTTLKETSVNAKDVLSFKDLANQVIKDIQARSDEAIQSIDEIKVDVKNTEDLLSKYKSEINSISTSINAKLLEIQSKYDSEEAARSKTYQDRINQLDNKINEYLKEITTKKLEAEKIVNLIGNIGLTGNFRGAATSEKQAADKLRNIALGCFAGMVLIVALTLFISVSNGFDPWLAFFRLGAGLTLIIPAAYAARESSLHRKRENKNRKIELELASIDAYLESIPSDKRNEIKADLTVKFFGNDEFEKDGDDVNKSDLLKLLTESINAINKK